MREIRELAKEIKEELADAEKYAKKYTKCKENNSVHARTYAEMTNDEIKHAMLLHGIVIEKIKEVQAKNVTVPEFMLALWDEEHDYYIEKMAEIKVMLDM